jgi:hypothetical protein
VKNRILRAGIITVVAGAALFGGTAGEAVAASSPAPAASVARWYSGIAFTTDEAVQTARQNLADGSHDLGVTCTEQSIAISPVNDNDYASQFGTWQALISATCSG